jgi:hypothetical protein
MPRKTGALSLSKLLVPPGAHATGPLITPQIGMCRVLNVVNPSATKKEKS